MADEVTRSDNSGSIFLNNRKTDKMHPDMTGSAVVAGQEFWVSAWVKPSKKDETTKYISLSFRPKQGGTDLEQFIPTSSVQPLAEQPETESEKQTHDPENLKEVA